MRTLFQKFLDAFAAEGRFARLTPGHAGAGFSPGYRFFQNASARMRLLHL
jgi:hypothetical protein